MRLGVPGSVGLSDKLYWRPTGRDHLADWHVYKKCEGGGYVSLCRRRRLRRSGGQACSRPPAMMRCARCDMEEMRRRGWDESGPTRPDWHEALP